MAILTAGLPEPTLENHADMRRDALALVVAVVAGDVQSITAISRGTHDVNLALIPGLLGLVLEVLHEHGTDPAQWAAGHLARSRARS